MKKVAKVSKIITDILTFLVFLILIVAIYGKVQMIFTQKSYPTYFGYTLFEVASGSMEPALYTNDVILVKKTQSNLSVGDIVSYEKNGEIITHRILYIDGDNLTVKGDNNNTIDAPISRSQVIGKVVKIFPKLKVWRDILTDYKVIALLFITLFFFDLALSYNPKKKETKKEKIVEVKKVSEDTLQPKENEKVEVKKISSEENKVSEEELLEITRKIDLNDINALLNKEDDLQEIKIVQLEEELGNTSFGLSKDKNVSEYTMRLDLKEIQKRIDKRVNKEK